MDESIPSEFAAFIREVGVRAFDRVAADPKLTPVPLRPLLRTWSKLAAEEKAELLDRLIASAQMPELAPEPKPRKRAPAKRYTPEEAEETLPKKKARKTKK